MTNKIVITQEHEHSRHAEQHTNQQISDYHEGDTNQSFSTSVTEQQKIQDIQVNKLKQDLDMSAEEVFIANLKQLLKDKNYDAIKEHIRHNDTLRISFHEAAHVIVGKKGSPKDIAINTISLGEQHNNATQGIQKKVDGISEGRVEWKNFFSFTDQHFVQVAIAGYALEKLFGISHETASAHAQQDFYDIFNRAGYDYIYENGRKPSHFNDKGDLVCTEVSPTLSMQEIKDALLQLAYAELQTTAKIIAANRDALYTVGVELFSKKSLDNTTVNTLLAS